MLVSTNSFSPLPDWTSDDAKNLKDLLSSETFQKALQHVVSETPELLDGKDVNTTLVASGKVQGFSSALQALFRLTFEQPKNEPLSQAYPSLDDDTAWENSKPNP